MSEGQYGIKCSCDFETEFVTLDENTIQCPHCKMKVHLGPVFCDREIAREIRKAEMVLRETLRYMFAMPGLAVPDGRPMIGCDSEEVKLGPW